MKLSKQTQAALAGLALINSNLLIKAGSKLGTCTAAKNLFAFIEVEEKFESEFGIYDLKEFLGALSVFDDPDVNFGERQATISEGKNNIRYLSAEASVLIHPKGQPKLPSVDVEFDLSGETLARVIKTASILKVDFVSVIGEDGKILLRVHNKGNKNSNQFEVEVGTTPDDFAIHFKADILKMPVEDYNVQISKQKIAQFTGDKKLYIVGAETDSTFG